jgi:hypothetical protein
MWLAYVIVIRVNSRKITPRLSLWLAVAAFAVVLACWLALDYMPAAGRSIHTYQN